MRDKSVLISGIGVAGPALAHWLLRFGCKPTLVERAPRLREGGYIIDFWGAGLDIVEKMGLLPDVLAAGYQVKDVRFVDARGRRVSGFNGDVFTQATTGRYTSLLRSDLSAILFRAVADRMEVIFNDTIVGLTDTGSGDDGNDGVEVRFANGAKRRFDLVVGADGLHSNVRELIFGAEQSHELYLRYTVAAFEISGYRPRDDDVYVLYSVPGVQVGRFAMRDDRTMVLIVVAEDSPVAFTTDAERKRYLRERITGAGAAWECDALLAALDQCVDLYFDRVSQIRMDSWSKGRVALIGDAAHCASLLAGQGAALAIVDAYVLAVELARAESHGAAFAAFENRLMPFVKGKQDAAVRFAGSFAPRSSLALFVRNWVMKAFVFPSVAKLAMGASLTDKIELPEPPISSARV